MKQFLLINLDEAATLYTAALDLLPPDHECRSPYIEALEHVDSLVRKALERDVLSHTDHCLLLSILARLLRWKFVADGNIGTIEEAITLRRTVLGLCPPEHSNYVSSLDELAFCLYLRFEKQAIITDLEEAITHSRNAVRRCPPEHPERLRYLRNLDTFRRKRAEMQRCPDPSASPSCHIQRLVNDALDGTIQNLPPRLLHTLTGALCNRDAQLSHFFQSSQYRQLIASSAEYDEDRLEVHIDRAVTMYFQYVSLSHRWGKREPVLRDVEGKAIYDLDPVDGVAKLQRFCLAAGERNYLWAWSDTCCIDKDSTVELQQAIGSMFTWYRQSSLTIVHLVDVLDSATGVLEKSIWFKRGWTLQELLAPHTILFFTREWSVYCNSSSTNHKKDAAIMAELEEATGISSSHLTGFYPGTDDARLRLQWASTRRTTLPEDMVYSLFGIFNIHQPVLYGESVEKALWRLLGEIVTWSGDVSILEWVGEPSSFHSCFPASITSYKTVPRPPPEFNSLALQVSAEGLRKIHDALTELPRLQFSNHRLNLPCIIHRITLVQSISGHSSSAGYVYRLQAAGLQPLEIVLSEELVKGSEANLQYILVRPWHPKLLGSSTDLPVEDLSAILSSPFCALLLRKMTHNEYKRIGSFTTIGACPSHLEHLEIETLTVM